jgi:hypothetical protein
MSDDVRMKRLERRVAVLEEKAGKREEVAGATTVVILNAIENFRRDTSSMFAKLSGEIHAMEGRLTDLIVRRRKGPKR